MLVLRFTVLDPIRTWGVHHSKLAGRGGEGQSVPPANNTLPLDDLIGVGDSWNGTQSRGDAADYSPDGYTLL
jgi:hypothetical protein